MDTLEKISEDIEEIKEENQNVVDNLNIDSLPTFAVDVFSNHKFSLIL